MFYVCVTLFLRRPASRFLHGHLQRHPEALQQQGEHRQAQTYHQAATRGRNTQGKASHAMAWTLELQ